MIANAGVSGDTSSGGLSRLDWSVPDGTQLVILELGANDMLRGVAPEITEKNLDAMISRLKEKRVTVLLAGMRAAPNLGPDYQAAFDAIFPRLAEKYGVALYPFFLDGVAADPAYQLEDGMHPNASGVDRMVERILPEVEKVIAANPGQFVSDAGIPLPATLTQGNHGWLCAVAKKPLAPSGFGDSLTDQEYDSRKGAWPCRVFSPPSKFRVTPRFRFPCCAAACPEPAGSTSKTTT